MHKSLLPFLGCALVLSCIAPVPIHAQSSAAVTTEVSTPVKTGDIEIRTAAAPLSIHYAVVPLTAKGVASFYTRFSQAVSVKNVITDATGRVIKTWGSEGAAEQCFTNISQDVFEQEAATGKAFSWVISGSDGSELLRISFTAADALGR